MNLLRDDYFYVIFLKEMFWNLNVLGQWLSQKVLLFQMCHREGIALVFQAQLISDWVPRILIKQVMNTLLKHCKPFQAEIQLNYL